MVGIVTDLFNHSSLYTKATAIQELHDQKITITIVTMGANITSIANPAPLSVTSQLLWPSAQQTIVAECHK